MRWRYLCIAFGLFVSYAWFYQAGGWNQNSRFDLVRAVVEQGTLRIDSYETNTGDKARFDGHTYSDKAPGLAFFAVPAALVVRPWLGQPGSETYVTWLSYAVTLWAASMPTVMAALLLLWAARRLGASESGAVFAALVFGLASPAWAYATLLFGHALATASLVAAWAGALALGAPASARRDLLLGLSVGLAGGWAVVTEHPFAVPAVLVFGLALAQVWEGGWSRRVLVAMPMGAGALLAGAALALHNLAIFGHVLGSGYAHLGNNYVGMRQGFMGVSFPKADALWGITFSSYRGLFFHAPVLVAGLVGWPLLLRQSQARRAGIVALAIALYFLLFNAAYFYWSGGWSHGPRHAAGAIPFLCLPLAWLWTRAGRFGRLVLGGLATLSLGITLVTVSTTAQSPSPVARPLLDLHWPAFRDGDVSLNHESFLESTAHWQKLRGRTVKHDAWNLGEKLGLEGKSSLLPLLALWAALLAAVRWQARGEKSTQALNPRSRARRRAGRGRQR